MITDADIDKMEKRFSKIFATKKELKTETERTVKLVTDEFKTVIEMIGDTNERMDKRFKEMDRRFDEVLTEIRMDRIVLRSHESRLQKIESCNV